MERLTDKAQKNPTLTLGNSDRKRKRTKRNDSLLKNGNPALSEFLTEIKEHNADVVSPSPDEKHDVANTGSQREESICPTTVVFSTEQERDLDSR